MLNQLNQYWLQEPEPDPTQPQESEPPDLNLPIVPQDIIDHNKKWKGEVWKDTGDDTGNDTGDNDNDSKNNNN